MSSELTYPIIAICHLYLHLSYKIMYIVAGKINTPNFDFLVKCETIKVRIKKQFKKK